MLHRDHDDFETIVVAGYLKNRGYLLGEATYHAVLPPAVAETLKQRYSPTSLYLRTRADRIAVHKTDAIEFEWEVKTVNREGDDAQNFALELVPLFMHKAKAQHGVRCLYAMRNIRRLWDVGFWCDSIPKVRTVFIPGRWGAHPAIRTWFCDIAKQAFPNAPVVDLKSTDGSDDPFVVIAESDAARLPSWQRLIDAETPSWTGEEHTRSRGR